MVIQARHYKIVIKKLKKEHPICERCHSAMSTDAHHVIPRSVRPDLVLDPGNLKMLCRPCHNWINENREVAYETGWLKRGHTRGADSQDNPCST